MTSAFALSGEAEGAGLVHPGARVATWEENSSPPAPTGRASRRQRQASHSGAWEGKRQQTLAETTEI